MGSATSAENTEHDEEAPQSSETETQNQRWVPQMVSGAVHKLKAKWRNYWTGNGGLIFVVNIWNTQRLVPRHAQGVYANGDTAGQPGEQTYFGAPRGRALATLRFTSPFSAKWRGAASVSARATADDQRKSRHLTVIPHPQVAWKPFDRGPICS